LDAAGQQRAVLGKDALHDDAAVGAGPGAVHLAEHPLVGPDAARLVEVDGVVEADEHADARAVGPAGRVGAQAQVLELALDLGALVGRHGGHLGGRGAVRPQPVDAGDGADEVAVRHVGQRVEVRSCGAARSCASPSARLSPPRKPSA
jgi:hypothetical protein